MAARWIAVMVSKRFSVRPSRVLAEIGRSLNSRGSSSPVPPLAILRIKFSISWLVDCFLALRAHPPRPIALRGCRNPECCNVCKNLSQVRNDMAPVAADRWDAVC